MGCFVQKVHVVEVDVGGSKRYQAGWGYVEFLDHKAAVKGMKRQALVKASGPT